MNLYYSIDDLSLDDDPIIVNMIVERANGQQIVSSLAPDAVVEEFDIQRLVDVAEHAETERRMHSERIDRYQAEVELEELKRVRDALYRDYNSALADKKSLIEKVDELEGQCSKLAKQRDKLRDKLQQADSEIQYKLARFEILKDTHKAVCDERDELKARLEASEKALKGES